MRGTAANERSATALAGSRRKHTLVVLAHQDDECAFSTRIVAEVAAGRTVTCAFLTDGAAKGVAPAVRDGESRRVLARLGAPSENLFFLGSRNAIPDSRLVEHLEESYGELESALARQRIDRVFCLAYEGGHQDHDASHLVALAFARRRGLLGRTWQFPNYNGHGTPWKLFRVQAPLSGPRRRCDRRLPFGLAWRHIFLWAGYPSQLRTWVGLFPEHFAKRALLRRETIQSVDPSVLAGRPHPGSLLYERLIGFPYREFRDAADPFVARHFA